LVKPLERPYLGKGLSLRVMERDPIKGLEKIHISYNVVLVSNKKGLLNANGGGMGDGFILSAL
jgi:hypothetical protein